MKLHSANPKSSQPPAWVPVAKCDLVRKYANRPGETEGVPPIVHDVLRSPGQPLDAATRSFFEPRFGHDFSHVRVHTDAHAAESARAVNALAYTMGRDVVFGEGQYSPGAAAGQHLLAHELTHVIQQQLSKRVSKAVPNQIEPSDSPDERQADITANSIIAGSAPANITPAASTIQLRDAPYLNKVTVHLTPPQHADLEWEGTPPATATGSDHFQVSTGKGYGDPGDPPGTCTRNCCSDALTQCAPPYNRPSRVGSCCTYYGSTFWTGTPEDEHGPGGWKFWTPIQPYYSSRSIALHQHTDVTGQPIGHGCVRMAEENARRIAEFSNGRHTNVTIDGRAAPVDCAASRQCSGSGSGAGAGATIETAGPESQMAAAEFVVPGLEGEMT